MGTPEILKIFFDADTIIENEALWKMNFSEKHLCPWTQPINEDGFNFTEIDSVFYYLENNTQKAFVIFIK